MFRTGITFDLSPVAAELERLTVGLGHKPQVMLKYMTNNVGVLITDYFRRGLGTTHKTAFKLGAMPTHFYPRKANLVSWKVKGNEGNITFPAAGASRAYYPYNLKPTGGRKLLTIPVHAYAYGKRARSIRGLKWRTFTKEDVQQGRADKAGRVLAKRPSRKGGMWIAYYRGVKQVHIPKDPDLMPSDGMMETAAEIGVDDYLNALFRAWI